MKMNQISMVAVAMLLAGCMPEKASSVERKVDWDKPFIVVAPETTRAISGISEVDRKRYFCLGDHGTDFDQRMKKGEGVYDYLVHELGVSFGRSLGPVKYIAKTIPEDPDRPGYADLSSLKNKKLNPPGEQFLNDFGPNLDVASHGNHNAYPEYMGKHFKGTTDHPEHPAYLPENIDAAAELAAAVMKYNYTDFDRPKYYEPLNEPHWEFFSDPHLAEWHLKTMEKVHKLTPEVQVGGLCMSVSYFFRDNYRSWNGLKNFIDMTSGKMDFYSFHSYDYFDWIDDDFRGRVQSGIVLEGSLDLLQNYAVNTLGKEVDVVVSEQGGYINVQPRGIYDGELLAAEIAKKHFPADTWENELKKRSIVCFVHVSSVLANTMAFLDHPHTVKKAVPFLLPNTWNWDPTYYAGLYVPYNYTDKSQWVETHMLDFYKFFRGVEGRRVKVLSNDPDLQTRAFVSGSKLYLAVNNQSWRPEPVALHGIGADQVEIRRFGRNDDYTAYFREETISTPETLELAGREAVMIVADLGGRISEKKKVNEIVCYGDKVAVPLAKAQFKIKVPVGKKVDYAVLRLGLTRPTGMSHEVIIKLNGKQLDVPLEDCADRLSKGEYGTTKMVYLNPAHLRAENMVTVKFPDGDEGAVGTAVIRVAVVE